MPGEPLRILLVEDNPGDARLVGTMLSDNDGSQFAVTHVNRLDEAVHRLAAEPYDAVLLDLSLPDSKGVATLEAAKGGDPESQTPIIVVTGHYSEEQGVATMQHGAQDFLVKGSLRAEGLIRSIRFAVERQRLRKQAEAAEAENRKTRELQSLEKMSAPMSTAVTARAYGLERLSEAQPDTFDMLLEQYSAMIEQAIEERKFKMDGKTSQDLRILAQRLGFLRAGPRDVVELHVRALKQSRPLKMTTSYVVAEEARLMLVELLGDLAAYYRDHMIPVAKARASESPQTPTNLVQK